MSKHDERTAGSSGEQAPPVDCISCDDTGIAEVMLWERGFKTAMVVCPDCKAGDAIRLKRSQAAKKGHMTRKLTKHGREALRSRLP